MKYLIRLISVILCLLIGCIALLYLNSVFANLWAYGGPPGDNKEYYLNRAYFHLAIFFGCLIAIGVNIWLWERLIKKRFQNKKEP